MEKKNNYSEQYMPWTNGCDSSDLKCIPIPSECELGGGVCKGDKDCNFNGTCENGKCLCYEGNIGHQCQNPSWKSQECGMCASFYAKEGCTNDNDVCKYEVKWACNPDLKTCVECPDGVDDKDACNKNCKQQAWQCISVDATDTTEGDKGIKGAAQCVPVGKPGEVKDGYMSYEHCLKQCGCQPKKGCSWPSCDFPALCQNPIHQPSQCGLLFSDPNTQSGMKNKDVCTREVGDCCEWKGFPNNCTCDGKSDCEDNGCGLKCGNCPAGGTVRRSGSKMLPIILGSVFGLIFLITIIFIFLKIFKKKKRR